MEKQRLAIFIAISALILFGSQFLLQKIYPPPKKQANEIVTQSATPAPAPTAAAATTQTPAPTAPANATQADAREIKIETPFWKGTLSNQGAVISEFIMTHLPDDDGKIGKPIDAPAGVLLVSAQKSKEIGAPLRLVIPSDRNLEKQLNEARFAVADISEAEIKLGGDGSKTITLNYDNGAGVKAQKIFTFNGLGYDFDCTVDVRRNDQPVEAFLVVGPSFGDQNVKSHGGFYSQESLATISDAKGIDRHAGKSIESAEPKAVEASQIRWASVDDNYFAMALMPANPASSVRLMNDKRKETIDGKEQEVNHVSAAVQITNGQINHVYAGPKNLKVLRAVSTKLNLGDGSVNLERVVNYGWNWITPIVKPIAWVMLNILQFIYRWTQNYGWAIIVLTFALNMCFFPLRWRSSVSMKKAAAMQPKMKDLQERMKKLDKNDPKMLDLQKEQMALMREGNPLMGCLPMLLQMPFFYAVYSVLTTAVEIRHTGFFGWIKDLAAPDPWYILPVVFVISMIVQQMLTPSTMDPVQKRVQYIMPVFMGYIFINAPAGLVLYWMVGNLVGIGQQYVINKISPAPPAQTTNDKIAPPITKKKSKELLADS